MSVVLVGQIRAYLATCQDPKWTGIRLLREAADRIEELEAELQHAVRYKPAEPLACRVVEPAPTKVPVQYAEEFEDWDIE